MFGLGVSEVLIILVAALIFIGPKKLPALAKTLGSAFREFQNATKGLTGSLSQDIHRDVHKPMEQSVDETDEQAPENEISHDEDSVSEDKKGPENP